MRYSILSAVLCLICNVTVGQNISILDSLKVMDGTSYGMKYRKKNDYRLATASYNKTASKDGVIIENSFPKGGNYSDRLGRSIGYRIFWTRVINETGSPLEVHINLPADTLYSHNSDFVLFLPLDTMTIYKESSYDYGMTSLQASLDNLVGKATTFKQTLNPNEECFFYVGLVFSRGSGVARAELLLNETNLFYRVNMLDPVLIACGEIVLKSR